MDPILGLDSGFYVRKAGLGCQQKFKISKSQSLMICNSTLLQLVNGPINLYTLMFKPGVSQD
jgi:hypothetical protein